MDFIETNYFDFMTYRELKNEVQTSLNELCSYYLENYKGTDKDNLESLRLFFSKFLKDNQKDSIFLSISQNTLRINVCDSDIDFLTINDALASLKNVIKAFKDFLND